MAVRTRPAGRLRAGAWPPAAAVGLVAALVLAGVWAAPGATGQVTGGDAAAGDEVYQANCMACHGPDAEGQGANPALVDVVDRLGAEEVERVVREGRAGMPPFDDRLDDDEIDDVVAHLAALGEDDEPVADPPGDGAGAVVIVVVAVVLAAAVAVAATVAARRGRTGADGADGPAGGEGDAPGR